MEGYKPFSSLLKKNRKSLDPESIHHIRKGTKQLRARLHLHKLLYGKHTENEDLKNSVKHLASMLAGHRDRDVMIALLQELLIQSAEPALTKVMQELQVKLRREHLPQLDIQKLAKVADEIDNNTDKLLAHAPGESEINAVLQSCLGGLCDTGHNVLNASTVNWDDLHDWRKQVKKLTYQYQLKPSPTNRDTEISGHLEHLGDILGKCNDFNILEKYTRQQQSLHTRAQTLETYKNLIKLLEKHQHELLKQCRQALSTLQSFALM